MQCSLSQQDPRPCHQASSVHSHMRLCTVMRSRLPDHIDQRCMQCSLRLHHCLPGLHICHVHTQCSRRTLVPLQCLPVSTDLRCTHLCTDCLDCPQHQTDPHHTDCSHLLSAQLLQHHPNIDRCCSLHCIVHLYLLLRHIVPQHKQCSPSRQVPQLYLTQSNDLSHSHHCMQP
jgi:hypothetical protein